MHGGKRLGAGRPYGSQNKATKKQKAEIDKIVASGLPPLDYMLSVMRYETVPHPERLDAAKAAASYVHPKLAAIAHSGSGEVPGDLGERLDAAIKRMRERAEAAQGPRLTSGLTLDQTRGPAY